MNLNKSLSCAKKDPNDEFYTQLENIERELRHYRHLKLVLYVAIFIKNFP